MLGCPSHNPLTYPVRALVVPVCLDHLFNHCGTEYIFFIENINICLNFLSFGCKTKQEAEICRRERQRPIITHSQFNGCCWPGDAIDFVLPKYFQEHGDVSLHFASSPSEVSWGCKFVDGMPNLQETLCYKLDDVSASPMRNRHLISNTKHVVR